MIYKNNKLKTIKIDKVPYFNQADLPLKDLELYKNKMIVLLLFKNKNYPLEIYLKIMMSKKT